MPRARPASAKLSRSAARTKDSSPLKLSMSIANLGLGVWGVWRLFSRHCSAFIVHACLAMCGREIAKALPTMSSCLTSSRAPDALHGTARPHASPVWVLLSVCLAALAMPLSFTGPAVALSALREALGGGPLALNWVTNAFMLSFGATLMAAGALADLHGRRRVFLMGLGVVLASALAQACLGGQGAIVVFNLLRALQGLGAAALRLTQGYANSPVCSPTRFALATARYQYRLRGAAEEPINSKTRGTPLGEKLGLPPDMPTVASMLRDAGYRTALIGKWHLGYPPDRKSTRLNSSHSQISYAVFCLKKKKKKNK